MALFSYVFLEGTKYYSNLYYRNIFGVRQDNQHLVGRRRPSGTPLPTRPCICRVSFTTSTQPFCQMIKYRTSVKIHVLLK